MFNFAKAVVASSAFAALALGATSAQAAEGTGTATATILEQITVTSDRNLSFGAIAPGTSAGDVVVNSAGTRTSCGVTASTGVCLGTTTSARFNIAGSASRSVAITVPSSTFTLTNTTGTGAETMNLTALSSSAATATLSTTGTASFTMGGTLSVGASQVAGDYEGTFTVTVQYN